MRNYVYIIICGFLFLGCSNQKEIPIQKVKTVNNEINIKLSKCPEYSEVKISVLDLKYLHYEKANSYEIKDFKFGVENVYKACLEEDSVIRFRIEEKEYTVSNEKE
jgi:hypothetical protein